jgi:hypothetical protein
MEEKLKRLKETNEQLETELSQFLRVTFADVEQPGTRNSHEPQKRKKILTKDSATERLSLENLLSRLIKNYLTETTSGHTGAEGGGDVRIEDCWPQHIELLVRAGIAERDYRVPNTICLAPFHV